MLVSYYYQTFLSLNERVKHRRDESHGAFLEGDTTNSREMSQPVYRPALPFQKGPVQIIELLAWFKNRGFRVTLEVAGTLPI
jgi:hypothetical protein